MNYEKSKKTESELLGKLIAGDDAAFYSLFSLYNKKLTVFAQKMLADREAARGLVQEVWIRVIELRRTPSSSLIEYVGAYFFMITRNLCLDKIRSVKEHLPIDEIPESDHPQSPKTEQTDLEEIVSGALEKLSPEDRELLVMHTYLGYAYEEIAKMQSKNPEAIWTRASRARAKLREFVRTDARKAGIDITLKRKTN